MAYNLYTILNMFKSRIMSLSKERCFKCIWSINIPAISQKKNMFFLVSYVNKIVYNTGRNRQFMQITKLAKLA